MAQVVISFCAGDSGAVSFGGDDTAARVLQFLKAQGYSVFMGDASSEAGGHEWAASIQDAIANCQVFVAICSPSYGTTKWSQREFALADSKCKPTIPLWHSGPYPPPKLEIYLVGAGAQRVPAPQGQGMPGGGHKPLVECDFGECMRQLAAGLQREGCMPAAPAASAGGGGIGGGVRLSGVAEAPTLTSAMATGAGAGAPLLLQLGAAPASLAAAGVGDGRGGARYPAVAPASAPLFPLPPAPTGGFALMQQDGVIAEVAATSEPPSHVFGTMPFESPPPLPLTSSMAAVSDAAASKPRDMAVRTAMSKHEKKLLKYAGEKDGLLEVRLLLGERNVNPNVLDPDGSSAVHLAAVRGQLDTLRALLAAGADPNVIVRGETTLLWASSQGQEEVVDWLLRVGAHVRAGRTDGTTPLLGAARNGHLVIVGRLLGAGADPDARAKTGDTPLVVAARKGNTGLVDMLLQAGADLAARDGNECTALHRAAEKGHAGAVEALLAATSAAAEAVINAVDKDGCTALHLAAAQGSRKVVEALLQVPGIDPNLRNKVGFTPLDLAWTGRHTEAMELLQRADAVGGPGAVGAPRFPEVMGTAGASAALPQQPHDMRARPAVTKAEKTLLSLAGRDGGLPDLQRLLASKGVNPNVKNGLGETALLKASRGGSALQVAALLAAGADPSIQSMDRSTALHGASSRGHHHIVTSLLQAGADPNVEDKDRYTPLRLACFGSHLAIAEALLEGGANPDVKAQTQGDATLAQWACGNRRKDILEVLLRRGVSVNAPNKDGNTLLHIAAKTGDIVVTDALLKADANPNAKSKNLDTPLHVAARRGHVRVVEALLGAKAATGERDEHGKTPLHCACFKGRKDVAEALLQGGAFPNPLDKDGCTPLDVATRGDHAEVVALLLRSDATNGNSSSLLQQSEVNSIGKGPVRRDLQWRLRESKAEIRLLVAAEKGYVLEVASLLADPSVNPNAHSWASESPLWLAACKGWAAVVEELLRAGADPNSAGILDETPLHPASREGHTQVVRALLQAGANPNRQADGRDCETPLHMASRRGHLAAVEAIISSPVARAQMDVQNKKGRTALHLSAKQGHVQVVEALLRQGADPSIRDNGGLFSSGQTAYDRAKKAERGGVLALLAEWPAKR